MYIKVKNVTTVGELRDALTYASDWDTDAPVVLIVFDKDGNEKQMRIEVVERLDHGPEYMMRPSELTSRVVKIHLSEKDAGVDT